MPDWLRPYWGQSLVKPACLKTYASGVLLLAGPPKLDWSRVTGHTGDSPWWSLRVWRPMPVECYSWQVHPSWIGRGWQAILGTVPGEACVSEDLCQWSVTPDRSTQAGLVEGDRPDWGRDSHWWSLWVWRPISMECYPWKVHPIWIGLGWGFGMGPTNPSLHPFPPGQSPLENKDFALEEEFDNTSRWSCMKVNLNLKSKTKRLKWTALPLIRLLQEEWWVWMRENGDKQGLLG